MRSQHIYLLSITLGALLAAAAAPGQRLPLSRKAAGGAALTTSLFTGDLKGANDKVNVAFIGVGRMGSENIGYCAHVPGFEIVAVCDVYQPALDAAYASHEADEMSFG